MVLNIYHHHHHYLSSLYFWCCMQDCDDQRHFIFSIPPPSRHYIGKSSNKNNYGATLRKGAAEFSAKGFYEFTVQDNYGIILTGPILSRHVTCFPSCRTTAFHCINLTTRPSRLSISGGHKTGQSIPILSAWSDDSPNSRQFFS